MALVHRALVLMALEQRVSVRRDGVGAEGLASVLEWVGVSGLSRDQLRTITLDIQ